MPDCRLCNRTLSAKPYFILENLPLGVQFFYLEEELGADKQVKLEIYKCIHCGFMQSFGNQIVYRDENTAATSISEAMTKHKIQQAKSFVSKYNLSGKTVFEAGCGDGHFLKMLKEAGVGSAVGVEPSNKSKQSSSYDEVIHTDFISSGLRIEGAPFDAFATFHVMEHLPDIHDFIVGLSNNLKVGGIGFIEVPSSELIENEFRFYDFINDHLNYFTLKTMALAFELHNFDILESYKDWNNEHNVTIVRKRSAPDPTELTTYMESTISDIQIFLDGFPNQNVAVWGASMHALTLLSQLRCHSIRYVLDSAYYKQNRFTPATHLPILPPSALNVNDVTAVVIIAPRFANEILDQINTLKQYTGQVFLLDGTKIINIR